MPPPSGRRAVGDLAISLPWGRFSHRLGDSEGYDLLQEAVSGLEQLLKGIDELIDSVLLTRGRC